MSKNKNSVGVLYKIVDCARIAFDPCAIDDPRGRIAVRATPATLQQWGDAI